MTQSLRKKILVLHGGHQTGELLLGRIAKLKKKLLKPYNNNDNKKSNGNNQVPKKSAEPLEMIAPDGPFESGIKEMMKLWWNRNGEGAECEYTGLEETLEMLHSIWTSSLESSSPFEGVFGFSQGARLAHLIAVLHSHSSGTLFPGLKFIVFVSGYYAPLPTNFPPPSFHSNLSSTTIDTIKETNLNIKTLHVIGTRDKLITPQQSRELASKYNEAVIHEHEMGHCVPMKAFDTLQMTTFIGSCMERIDVDQTKPHSKNDEETKFDQIVKSPDSPPVILPDEEHAQIQIEECESLELIYPDEFKLESPFEYNDPDKPEEGKSYSHPICYSMSIHGDDNCDDGLYPKKPLALRIQYPPMYPDVKPILSLKHDMNLLEFKVVQEKACLQVVRQVAEAELGMPCIMSCVLALREYIEDGGLEKCLTEQGAVDTTELCEENEDATDNKEISENGLISGPTDGTLEFLPSVSRERMNECDAEGQAIAEAILHDNPHYRLVHTNSQHSLKATNIPSTHQGATNTSTKSSSSKGGEWRYTIGLVGKPSAGKSTFFNAASAFARQRDDNIGKEVGEDGGIIFGASMAPHPFTTIDPNIGFCLVPAPPDSCPEDDGCNYHEEKKGNNNDKRENYVRGKIGCTHGRDSQGRRLLPVTLKDVAGLVPGAYQGRGKGNKFLNDLTDADVLIHVVDASGMADTEGNQVGEGVHPLNDLAWIRNELLEWIYGNVACKWAQISRKGKDKLLEMFSGYRQTQTFLLDVLHAVEKYLERNDCGGCTMAELHAWDQGDLRRLISAYLGVRFPMALALNKSDLPSASKFVQDIIKRVPVHGARVGVGLCARDEMNFMKQNILSSSELGRKDETACSKNCNGVWQCLQSAVSLREPVLVFPVSDMSIYATYPGMDDYATRDSSLPSLGMISCLVASGGVAPSLWNNDRKAYVSRRAANSEPLRDALMMKQGSTVEDVFLVLKRMGALSGEFVRAEAAKSLGEKPKLVSKHDVMGRHNRIIKIMTTKRKEWQKR